LDERDFESMLVQYLNQVFRPLATAIAKRKKSTTYGVNQQAKDPARGTKREIPQITLVGEVAPGRLYRKVPSVL